MKRLNAKTRAPFKRGDVRENGFFFLGYQTKKDKNGMFYESWVRPNVWQTQISDGKNTLEKHVNRTLSHIKSRAKKSGIPFNLSTEYAVSIAVDTCPALGVKLAWAERNGRQANSPSLDKIIPELGYVEGNVMWLSNKANMMKNDATKDQLKKFANWILKEKIGNTSKSKSTDT